MKRFLLISCIITLMLFPAMADDTSYSGSAAGYKTASASLSLSTACTSWLKESSGGSEVSVVKYGFYTNASATTPITKNTIAFTEHYKSTSGNNDSYSGATANAVLYFYILSNNKHTATLKWTQLKRVEDNTACSEALNVTVTANGISVSTTAAATEASTTIYTFDPSSSTGTAVGICQYGEVGLSMKTEDYVVDGSKVDENNTLTYNGTMYLVLKVGS